MEGQVTETQCVENNLDPMFYELIELNIDFNKGEDLPPFVFDVYDVDKALIGKDDRDYLGRAIVDLKDIAHSHIIENDDEEREETIIDSNGIERQIKYIKDRVDLKPEVHKWHPIKYSAGGASSGKILVSMILCEADDHKWYKSKDAVVMMSIDDPKAVVPLAEYRVELNVLGLRNLASPGLLPVKKAYIDFLLKSMVPPMAAQALSSISTNPGPAGPNPTINSVISFNVPMPLDPLYAPSMAVRVYDKVFKGFSGQLIGCFSIPIGQIMIDQEEEYKENCDRLDNIIEELTKVLEGPAIRDYQPS